MKVLILIIAVIVAFLSIAAGAAKILAAPQEVQFFEAVGVSATWMMPLGILQVVGGVLGIPQKTRQAGVLIVVAGFLVSTAMIFATGNVGFGVSSLLPVLLALVVLWLSRKEAKPQA